VQCRKGALNKLLVLARAGDLSRQTKNYFGDLYRRGKARLRVPKAITAMAHQLARIL